MEIPEGTKFKMFVEAHKQFLRIKLKRELEKKDFILSEKDVTETVAKNKEHLKKPHFNFSEYDIEDIFQESVIALYNNIGTHITCSLESYFYSIFRNQALKYYRKQKKIVDIDNVVDDPQSGERIFTDNLDKIFFFSSSPEEECERNLMKENVYKALDEMADKCRKLLTRFYIEGYNWHELAEALDLDLKNSDNAKAAAYQCRKRFKEKYYRLKQHIQ